MVKKLVQLVRKLDNKLVVKCEEAWATVDNAERTGEPRLILVSRVKNEIKIDHAPDNGANAFELGNHIFFEEKNDKNVYVYAALYYKLEEEIYKSALREEELVKVRY